MILSKAPAPLAVFTYGVPGVGDTNKQLVASSPEVKQSKYFVNIIKRVEHKPLLIEKGIDSPIADAPQLIAAD